MLVKIGDQIFDGHDQPILVVLTDQDKKNISNMCTDSTKYAIFPDDWGNKDEMLEWMGEANK